MIWTLRIIFIGILLAMLSVTTWASLQENILEIPTMVLNDPWFIATMFDAYSGFLTFFAWLCYRSPAGVFVKTLWFLAIVLLGNIAMASYMLMLLFKLPANAPLNAVWRKPESTVS